MQTLEQRLAQDGALAWTRPSAIRQPLREGLSAPPCSRAAGIGPRRPRPLTERLPGSTEDPSSQQTLPTSNPGTAEDAAAVRRITTG